MEEPNQAINLPQKRSATEERESVAPEKRSALEESESVASREDGSFIEHPKSIEHFV